MAKQYGIKFNLRDVYPANMFARKDDTDEVARRRQVMRVGVEQAVGILAEQLRYAGLIDRGEIGGEITIWCPRGLIGAVWQQQNCDRMRSFGIRTEPVIR